jgi:hypothetical protein
MMSSLLFVATDCIAAPRGQHFAASRAIDANVTARPTGCHAHVRGLQLNEQK